MGCLRAEPYKHNATFLRTGVCPMRNAIKTHASGPRCAKCGRRCGSGCLQLQGVELKYEVFGEA
jgi:hypothetical protein